MVYSVSFFSSFFQKLEEKRCRGFLLLDFEIVEERVAWRAQISVKDLNQMRAYLHKKQFKFKNCHISYKITGLARSLIHIAPNNELHNLGYAHGDLKLENVLLDKGSPLLTDFGNAAPIINFKNSLSGSAGCRPLFDTGNNGVAFDLWALGVLLDELFFQGDVYWLCKESEEQKTSQSDFIKKLMQTINKNESENQVIGNIIRSLLELDPNVRVVVGKSDLNKLIYY